VPLSTAFRKPKVVVRGGGVAASCCRRLLDATGFSLSSTKEIKARIPAILLSENTQELLRDVYGQPVFFDGLFQIDRRIVAWGRDSAPVELPHRAVVVSEDALLEWLDPKMQDEPAVDSADWTVYASRPLPAPAGECRFGTRSASAIAVLLKTEKTSACWIESLECGWLFLIPDGTATGRLIAVGDSAENLLAQSGLIAKQVEVLTSAESVFPAYPRIADPVCAPGWLACGSAALAFDPLCGDGTGNAVREAILAAAVIRSAADGGEAGRLLAHYRTRLIAGFFRHLELCRRFYVSANCGSWWAREIAGLEEGIAWCRSELAAAAPFRYRLNGFDLEAIE
jgi:hypothetical protein